jgi:hypothetical protein
MKRSIRYRIAKFNRFSMELRFTLQGPFINCWYWWRYPREWEGAKELLRREREARTFYA